MSLRAGRHREREGASGSDLGVDGEVSVVHPRDLARKPQAEAGALDGGLAVDATEAREQALLVVACDTDALIHHRDHRLVTIPPNPPGDLAAGRPLLGRVAQQVADDA